VSDSQPAFADRAVFLSYASQDAEAAKRICEGLRAAGIEGWFDQNELSAAMRGMRRFGSGSQRGRSVDVIEALRKECRAR
jgi:hypothetical protein